MLACTRTCRHEHLHGQLTVSILCPEGSIKAKHLCCLSAQELPHGMDYPLPSSGLPFVPSSSLITPLQGLLWLPSCGSLLVVTLLYVLPFCGYPLVITLLWLPSCSTLLWLPSCVTILCSSLPLTALVTATSPVCALSFSSPSMCLPSWEQWAGPLPLVPTLLLTLPLPRHRTLSTSWSSVLSRIHEDTAAWSYSGEHVLH